MATLGDYGADAPPPITTAAIDDEGLEQCPVCDTHLDVIETAVIEIPVATFANDVIAGICRRGDVLEVRSRGDVCGNCGALFPHTVPSPAANGWEKHVGTRVEQADGCIVRVPTVFEDFPEPLQNAINEAMRP